jgi:hypothetical protein
VRDEQSGITNFLESLCHLVAVKLVTEIVGLAANRTLEWEELPRFSSHAVIISRYMRINQGRRLTAGESTDNEAQSEWLLPYEAVFLLLALALVFAWWMDKRKG